MHTRTRAGAVCCFVSLFARLLMYSYFNMFVCLYGGFLDLCRSCINLCIYLSNHYLLICLFEDKSYWFIRPPFKFVSDSHLTRLPPQTSCWIGSSFGALLERFRLSFREIITRRATKRKAIFTSFHLHRYSMYTSSSVRFCKLPLLSVVVCMSMSFVSASAEYA
jgi:hypothetical protein